MFSSKALTALLLSTLCCHALIIPPDVTSKASELQARNPLVDLETRAALEAEAIEYAEQGSFDKYHEVTVRTARLYGDDELADLLEAPPGLKKRAASDACLRNGKFAITARSALACWDATYNLRRGDPHYHLIGTTRSVLVQLNQGHREAVRAGAKLIASAQEADLAAQKKRAALEPYVASRSLDVTAANSVASPDLFGIQIHWHFLDLIAHWVEAISSVIVAVTVCAEGYLAEPAFLLLTAVVWGVCGFIAAEIVPAVIELVGTIEGR